MLKRVLWPARAASNCRTAECWLRSPPLGRRLRGPTVVEWWAFSPFLGGRRKARFLWRGGQGGRQFKVLAPEDTRGWEMILRPYTRPPAVLVRPPWPHGAGTAIHAGCAHRCHGTPLPFKLQPPPSLGMPRQRLLIARWRGSGQDGSRRHRSAQRADPPRPGKRSWCSNRPKGAWLVGAVRRRILEPAFSIPLAGG